MTNVGGPRCSGRTYPAQIWRSVHDRASVHRSRRSTSCRPTNRVAAGELHHGVRTEVLVPARESAEPTIRLRPRSPTPGPTNPAATPTTAGKPDKTPHHRSHPSRRRPARRRRRRVAEGHDVSRAELEALLVVQEHDTALDRLRHRRATLPERARARSPNGRSCEPSKRVARRCSGRVTPCLPTNAVSTTKRARSEPTPPTSRRSLYSGSTNSPRELQAMQADLDMLKRQRLRARRPRARGDGAARDARCRDRGVRPRRSSASTAEAEKLRDAIAGAEQEIDAEIAAEATARDEVAAAVESRHCCATTSNGVRRTRARARPGSSARPATRAT